MEIPSICLSPIIREDCYNVIVIKSICNIASPKSINGLHNHTYYVPSGEVWDPITRKLESKISKQLLSSIACILKTWKYAYTGYDILLNEFNKKNITFIIKSTVTESQVLDECMEKRITEIEDIIYSPKRTRYDTFKKGDYIIQKCADTSISYIYKTCDIYNKILQMTTNPKYNLIFNIVKKKILQNIYPCRDYYKLKRHIWEFITQNGNLIQIYINISSDGWIIEEYNPTIDTIIIHKL